MRIIRTVALAAVALVAVLGTPRPAHAQVRLDVNLTVFHDGLSGYGRWTTHARYGDVWIPQQPRAWRPYSVGSWAYSDDGWTWVSDEPWAWATYHYGRWAFDDAYGWIWVPDTTWGPSWVAWRSSDDYTGWAPLPPGVAVSDEFDPQIDPFEYVFVPTRYVCDPHLVTYIEPQARNVTFVRLTTNATRFSTSGGIVIDRGVRIENVEHVIGHAVPRVTIQATSTFGPTRVAGGRLSIYRPQSVVLDHGARYTGPVHPVHVETSAELAARQSREDKALVADQTRQHQELERQHQVELAHPPTGLTKQQVTARQETEHQAEAQNAARQKQAQQARHVQEQHDQDNGRGRGRGRGGL
jgi:hypothetical protein